MNNTNVLYLSRIVQHIQISLSLRDLRVISCSTDIEHRNLIAYPMRTVGDNDDKLILQSREKKENSAWRFPSTNHLCTDAEV